jgi:hypothetical protein
VKILLITMIVILIIIVKRFFNTFVREILALGIPIIYRHLTGGVRTTIPSGHTDYYKITDLSGVLMSASFFNKT